MLPVITPLPDRAVTMADVRACLVYARTIVSATEHFTTGAKWRNRKGRAIDDFDGGDGIEKMCSYGAIMYAARLMFAKAPQWGLVEVNAQEILDKVAGRLYQVDAIRVNDERTHDEVIEMFNQAIGGIKENSGAKLT